MPQNIWEIITNIAEIRCISQLERLKCVPVIYEEHFL
jgi:hypothetical protein